MSEPEIKLVVDECGRIVYRVTNEGVLLSKDEKEFIASHILHLQAENATLERRIDELCIEKQRLLEEVMSLEAALGSMHIINDRYRANHARLTEFAEDAYSFAYNCYHGVCEQETFLRLRAKRNDLRELGIEVDG